MSFAGLRIGASGLSTSQKGVDVAAHNVANVNTDGYTRQRVVQAANRPSEGIPGRSGDGMRGTGVTVADLDRLRSAFADSAWRSQASVAADAAATATVMTRVENLLGDLESGLPVAFNAMFDSFADLAVSPADPAARAGVISAANTVANEMNTLARGLRQVGPDSTSKTVDLVASVNSLAAQVAALNRGISDSLVSGQQPSDLMDARDKAVDQLASLIGARAGTPDSLGRMDVYLAGEPLVRGTTSYQLTVTPTAAGPDVTFADGRDAAIGGEVGGLVHTATITVPDILAGFDAWAVDFMAMVNAAHAAGAGIDGVSGRDLFTGTGAGDLTVTPGFAAAHVAASASGAAADGNNALTLSQLRDVRDAAATSIGDRLRGRFSQIGLATQQANIIASSAAQVQGGLESSRLAEHSVNVDEEMVDMVRYQRAYEASARVVTVADQLLDTLINRTGRG